MHPETKKLTQKNMPYLTLTLTENLKLQLSPGLVASYDIQPGDGVGLFWDKHTRLLTYLLAPDPHGAVEHRVAPKIYLMELLD